MTAIVLVLLGFCVGRLMLDGNKSEDRASFLNSQLITLFLVGVILTFSGFLLSYGCPINKKIWSPTYVLVTCGLASSFLALLIWIIDVKGYKKWSMFFEAFGVNPLFMYVLGGVLSILFGSISFPWGNSSISIHAVSYTHLRAHETRHDLVCRLLLEKKNNKISTPGLIYDTTHKVKNK